MSDEELTHFDEGGSARMVAVENKPETARRAIARGRIRMAAATLARIEKGEFGKGDVLGVARLAAIGAAKATANLIPLCHPVRITAIDVQFKTLSELPGVEVVADVRAVDRTGPEMEAMAAASVAALTIYDMCKGVDRAMVVDEVCLLEKSGGKSGQWSRKMGP